MKSKSILQNPGCTDVHTKPISEIVTLLNLQHTDVDLYGQFKAKFTFSCIERLLSLPKRGKLILMTAMTPTKFGEGKTTVAIGLAQAMNRLGQSTVVCLRQPSLGPVFGIKGGATGGGLAKLFPSDDINLHFTGDFHAITSANNLLAAMIDNHIFHGNKLSINPETISFRRAMDMNDRSLRKITTSETKQTPAHSTGFDITAASEVMAIICMSKSIDDLKARLGNIVVARNNSDEPIFARDIEAVNAMAALLCDAIRPNLAQTYEAFPAIIHGGPFANIAHGCSSINSTKLGLRLADFAVTEAGFAADLGFEKYCDIVAASDPEELAPDIVVLTVTIKALKRQGGVAEDSLNQPSPDAVANGFANLKKHAEIVRQAGLPLAVAINKHSDDTPEEISLLGSLCQQNELQAAIVDSYNMGGAGSTSLAELILALSNSSRDFQPLYDLSAPLIEKLEQLCKNVYGAKGITMSDEASSVATWIINQGFDKLPLCVAKTQYSLSDDPHALGVPINFQMHVNELILRSGAGFIVVKMGPISTMPGLPTKPNAQKIDVDSNGTVLNIG